MELIIYKSLQNFLLTSAQISSYVVDLGVKGYSDGYVQLIPRHPSHPSHPSQPSHTSPPPSQLTIYPYTRMAYTSTGFLFYGDLANNAVNAWNASSGGNLADVSPVQVFSDNRVMQWQGTSASPPHPLPPLFLC